MRSQNLKKKRRRILKKKSRKKLTLSGNHFIT
jgi:hypothetical protein